MKNMHKLIAKIRRCSIYLGVFAVMVQAVSAQNITRIEYFYDTDPGFGSGTPVLFTPAADVSSLTFSAGITSLSYGLHTLYIRSRDAANKWSQTNYSTFVRYQAPTGSGSNGNIVKLEYFIDTDPGFGLGTNVPVTASLDISNQNFNVSLTALSSGLHTLYVRSKDANGKWSLTNYGTFVKYQATTGQPGAANIVKLEYFVDTDPGFGLGTNVPVTAAQDIANQSFNVSLTALTGGLHTLYIRSKDANGKWSLTNYGTFVKYVAPTGQPAAGNIVKMEYFVDADPGFGAATNVPVTAATDIPNTVFSVNLIPLSGGLHTLYVRTKDSNGKWSLTNLGTFVKYIAQTGPAAAGAVTRIEYFIDNDPGFGHGINIPFAHAPDVSNLVANINLTTLPHGSHTFYIRSRDTLDKWSLTNYGTFIGGSDTLAPEAVINTNGSDTFCLGAGTYLYATYSFASNYQWLLNNAPISGATNISYTPTQTGNYSVIVANSIGTDTSLVIHVVVNAVPTATISANGSLTFCQGGSVGLSVNATSGATYQWYLNNNAISGATSTSYSATVTGVFDVVVSVLGGCSTTSARDTVAVFPTPAATITPGGNTTFCTGDSVTLFANTGTGLTYHWSTNATSSSIKVFTAGNIGLTVTTANNCSAAATPITITTVAAPTATITPNGPTTFCNGSSVLLQANTGSGLSYLWTGGSTGSSLSVNTSGSYSVTVSNAGCSKVSSPVTVTVNPGPVVHIAATSVTVCAGHTDTLTASGATTYAWSGNGLNTSTGATVIATPSATTVYTVTGTTSGCIGTASDTVNVNGSQTSVSTLTPSICSGGQAVLNASGAVTYAWSPSGTLNASTGASVTATPASTTTYTVTGTSGTCASTATVTINVNNTVVPSVTISATQQTMCAGVADTFRAVAVNGGASPTYQWYKNGVIQIGSTTTFITSSLANNDSVWCIMISSATCPSPASATSNKVHVTVNAVVVPTVAITANQNPVCAGDSITFTAAITNGGTSPTYVWKRNNITVGSNAAAYTLLTPTSNDSVICVLTSNAACPSPVTVTSNKIKVIVNQVVSPTILVTASQNPICAGTNVTFNTTITQGGTNPGYLWFKNGVTLGVNSSSYVDNTLVNNDSVWCVLTSNATCVSPSTVTSNKVVITVAAQVVPSVTVTTPLTSICSGTSPTFTANPTNGGANPNYQWYKNGVLQAGNTNTYTSSIANNDSVWCVMTSSATCPVPTTATSAKVHMTVNPIVVPTISITASVNPICAGDTVTFTAAITNGGTPPVYQWKRNGVNVGSNAATYGSIALANNDSVWCVLTSNAPCPQPASATSAKVHMTVNPIVTPTISVSATQTTICAGTPVTFTASITNGGTSPAYQWYKNGNAVGTSLSTYSDNGLAANDSVWCMLASNANCRSISAVMSNKIVITITTTVVPSVTISASLTTVCANTLVTFTAVATNGGTPTYQWYKNGVFQAGNTNVYSSTTLANNDSVWCGIISNANCVSPTTATSNRVYMTVNPIVVPTISVTASVNPICAGDTVTFTAVITNGGAAPVYQWKRNGVNVGSNAATYGSIALANNDSVWCVLTSNAPCPQPASVTSTKVHMTVNPIVVPTISVSATQTTICAGTQVTFTASVTNGGSVPAYQWYKNGSTVGTNLSTYADNTLAGNDSVWCVLTSNASCRSISTATSNKIVITITTTVISSVIISASLTTVCANTLVTFTAVPTNGGTPTYQWYKNGVLQAGNTGVYSSTTLANNDSVWSIMTSNANCVSPATATSNKVHMTVNPIVVPTVSVSASVNPICAGDTVTFTAVITNGGAAPVYQWKRNGVNVGSNAATYGSIALANNDSVWCVLTSNAPCPQPASVTSAKVHMTVNPIVVPTISVSATQTTICAGTQVTFTASITNGGTSPAYQWYKNGNAVGTSLSTYSDNSLVANDSVWCMLASNANCRSISAVMSNKIVITITTTVVPSVIISASLTTACANTLVTFTAVPTNGGTPTYRWYKDGVLQAGNTGVYSSTTLANNDSVWCVMTSNANCVSPATATSNKVVMTINPVVVPAVVITPSQNPVCAGDSITLTSVVSNGGTNPLYNWIVDGAALGVTTSTCVIHAPSNNDSVWCAVTSNAACASPPNTVSNKVRITVNPIVSPSVRITASQNNICTGNMITFTATPVNGGNTPVYLWYKNGALTGGDSSTYNDNALVTGDSIWCKLVSNANCLALDSVSSNKIGITVSPTLVASVTIAASQTTGCPGTVVSFTATPVNGGLTPGYKWFVNHIDMQAGGSPLFNDTLRSPLDSVYVVFQSSVACPSQDKDTSNVIAITELPAATYRFAQNICQGDSFRFNGRTLRQSGAYHDTLNAANGCDSIVTLTLGVHSAYRDSSDAAVCQGYTYHFNGRPLSSSGVYVDSLQTQWGCDSIVVLNLTVHPNPVAVITRAGADTLRTTVAFTSYKWLLNNAIISAADTSRQLLVLNDGNYSVVVTDSFGCSDTSTAINIIGLGMNEAASVHLLVYPNPTDGLLHVQAEIPGDGAKLELRDALGRTIYEKELSRGTVHDEVNMSGYSAALYLLVIKNASGILTTQRVVKN